MSFQFVVRLWSAYNYANVQQKSCILHTRKKFSVKTYRRIFRRWATVGTDSSIAVDWRKNKVAAGGYDITSRTTAAITQKTIKKTLLFTHYEEFYSYHYACKVTAI